MSEALSRPVLYLDTNVFIYAVEGEGEVALSLQDMFRAFKRASFRPITSELTLAEILCSQKLSALTHRIYMNLIVYNQLIELKPVSRPVLLGSADLRRKNPKYRLADAIHAHTAFNAQCSLLMTNDLRFGSLPPGTTLLQPNEDGIAYVLSALNA